VGVFVSDAPFRLVDPDVSVALKSIGGHEPCRGVDRPGATGYSRVIKHGRAAIASAPNCVLFRNLHSE
jgi:hypothetical protein